MSYSESQFNQFAQEHVTGPKADFPWAPTVGIGLPVGAFAAGFIKTGSGKRVWDYYFQTLRQLEGTIPMGMLQTFHFSEAISPFAAPTKIDLLAKRHPKLFESRGFHEYLSHVTGKRITELEESGAFTKGLFWKRTGSTLGDLRVRGGPIIASNIAAVSTGARRGGFLTEWLGHVMGVKNPAFMKKIAETGEDIRPQWMFAGGGKTGSKAKLAGRYGYAMISSVVGRMNLLLKSPFDLEIVEDWVQKAPILKGLNLGVKPGPAHKMLWRYTKKGSLAFAAYKAFDYADYLGREYGVSATVPMGALGGVAAGLAIGLRRGGGGKAALIGGIAGGILGLGGEGPISALAGTYAKARIGQAEIAETTGLGAGARRAEDYFPGLTKPSTLIAAAATGLLLGGTKDWGEKLKLVRSISAGGKGPKAGGQAARDVFEQVDEAVKRRRESLYKYHQARAANQSGLGKVISQLKSRYYGQIKKGKFVGAGASRVAMLGVAGYEALNIAGTIAAGDYVGAAFQTAAVGAAGYAYAKKGGALSFGILLLSSLLREKEDPEKLKRIYRGEEKVAIRSGRWWEAGSTPYKGRRPYYRPHRVAMIRSGADKAALFGEEKKYWETDPFLNPVDYLINPYAREELMWEQGYKFPVSRTPLEDAPVLGPILAATIGKIIKPPKFMGREEWLPEKLEQGPAGMTEISGSEPIMRTGLKGTIGEQLYRFTELCLSGDTLILMHDRSEKTIAEVAIGERVYTDRGPRNVLDKFSHRLVKEEDLREIRVQGVSLPIRLTYGHQVLALKVDKCNRKGLGVLYIPNGSRIGQHCRKCSWRPDKNYSPKWYEAGSLKKGDYWIRTVQPIADSLFEISILDYLPESYTQEDHIIVRTTKSQVPVRKRKSFYNYRNTLVNESVLREHTKVNRTRVNLPNCIPLNFDFGWLLGYTLAEGHIRKYQCSWGGHIDEIDTNFKRLSKTLNSFFGVVPTVHRKLNGSKEITNGIEAVISSVDLSNLFLSLLGVGKNKRLHIGLETANKDFLIGILNGMIDGDGHIRKKEITIRLCSRELICQLRDIFNRCGIYAGMSSGFSKNPESNRTYKRHGLTISTNGILSLLDFINKGEKLSRIDISLEPSTEHNFVKFVNDEVHIYHRVLSNKSLEIDQILVYDLEIEDRHTFIANDLLVHNSGLPGFAMQSIKEKLTGSPTFFEEDQWATSSLVSGAEPSWWSLQVGGAGLLCIPEGSIVRTIRGNIPIEEIVPGDKVFSRDSEFHIVEATSVRRDSFLCEVRIPSLGLILKATPNHRVPIWESSINKIIDVPIEDITTDNFIEIPLPKKNLSRKKIELFLEIDCLDKSKYFLRSNCLYVKVEEVESIILPQDISVYDLLVEGCHYFTAGFISVHNSEGIRRYIPRRRSEVDYKNPLPSDLPSWLPGPSSGYFLDFSRADIYTKIKEPWARLPGKGLEKLRPELKGIDPEFYNDFNKFRVLADVSPWSMEYGIYNRAMSSAIAKGTLTAEQVLEVHTIRKQVQDVKRAKQFQQYKYDPEAIERKTVRVTKELEPGVYLTDTFGSAPIALAGIDTSATSLAGVARLDDASLTARQSVRAGAERKVQAADFLRDYVYPGAEIDVFVHKDPSNLMERGPSGRPQIAAVASVGGLNLNRELVERGLAESMAEGEALDPMMATAGVQRSLGRFWENLTHGAETPLESFVPLAPVAKFIHQRTALEEYQRSEVYGRDVALWQKPLEHFVKPGLNTTAWWAGWRGVSREVQERYMVEEYFDRLKYDKWSRLQRKAAAEGDARLAAQYQRQTRRTKTGANVLSKHTASLALSTKERAYFKEFIEAPTAAERRNISQIVSPQMGKILHAQWARRAAESARMRQEAGIAVDGDLASITRFDSMRGPSAQTEREQEIRNAQENLPVPGPRWVGWQPESEIEDYKVKTVLDRDMDAASYGVWRSDIRRVSRRPWVQTLDVEDVEREMISTGAMHRMFNTSTGRSGSPPPHVYLSAGAHRRIEVASPGHDRLNRYLRDPSIMQF